MATVLRPTAEVPLTKEERALAAIWFRFLNDASGIEDFLTHEVTFTKTLNYEAAQILIERMLDEMAALALKAAQRIGMPGKHLDRAVYDAIQRRTGQLVLQVTAEQRSILKKWVADSLRDGWRIKDLQKQLRWVVGLTERQQSAVRRYYYGQLEAGYTQQQAAGKASGYSRRLRRQRAWTIARTESSFAYNQGRLDGWKQMKERGMLDWRSKKVWRISSSACQICVPLDGVVLPLEMFFDTAVGMLEGPPAHVQCRCILDLYYDKDAVGVT